MAVDERKKRESKRPQSRRPVLTFERDIENPYTQRLLAIEDEAHLYEQSVKSFRTDNRLFQDSNAHILADNLIISKKLVDEIISSVKSSSDKSRINNDILVHSDFLSSKIIRIYNEFIEIAAAKISSPKQSSQDVSARLFAVEQYANQHGGKGIIRFLLDLFPEIPASIDVVQQTESTFGPVGGPGTPETAMVTNFEGLPVQAPKMFVDREDKATTAPEFIQDVYAPWLGNGLTRSHIRALDPTLYKSLENWLFRNGQKLPEGMDLPSRRQANDRLIEKLDRGEPVGVHSKREADRIASMLRRRKSENEK